MTSVLLLTLLAHGFLVVLGLSIIQLADRHRRIPVFVCVPFAWGIGGAVVYTVAKLVLSTTFLANDWHGLTTATCVFVVAIGVYFYLKAEGNQLAYVRAPIKIQIPHFVLGLLIVAKLAIVAHLAVINPVFDSDATMPYSYTSLSKHLILNDLSVLNEAPEGFVVSQHVPLLNAWLGGFWHRWHDSLAALTWFFYYFFIIYGVIVVCLLLRRRLSTSLMCGYLFSALPLIIHHVIRPGFHDLPAAYFFMLGNTAVLLYFFSIDKDRLRSMALLLFVVALIFLPTVKLECFMWSAWLLFVWFSLYVLQVRRIVWHKVLIVQLLAIVFIYLLYFLSADFIRHNIELSSRLQILFTIKPFNEQAFITFFENMLVDASFSLWWWLVIALSIALIVWGINMTDRFIGFYVLLLLLTIFYFSNFTDNIRFTISGTNVSRSFIQIHSLLLLVYVLSAARLESFFARDADKRA